jgi:serine/threonine protein kinase
MVMRCPDAEVSQIMSQILSAIRFLHLRKIVHCDLKVVPRPRALNRNNLI